MRKNKKIRYIVYVSTLLTSFSCGKISINPNIPSINPLVPVTSDFEPISDSEPLSINDELGYTYGSLKYSIHDFINTTTPNVGDVNVLVVPINLSTASDAVRHSRKLDSWDEDTLSFIERNYSGDQGKEYSSNLYFPTFKDYYEDVSNNKEHMHVNVAPVYNVSSSTLISKLESTNKDNLSYLYAIFEDACKVIQENDATVNASNYDKNNDGKFDAVHFITNYKGASWEDILWPHMSYTELKNKSYIVPNVYSLSSIDNFTDSLTAIHEQGHMFGLQDYYSYSQAPRNTFGYNFLGYADMQFDNSFDWNSFSKLVVGWANPYVITGTQDEVTITLKASAINGDCLIVPANYETFNKTPFDEYFLFELFSKDAENEISKRKINEVFWTQYENNSYSLGEYGVRAYYVHGNLYATLNSVEKEIDTPVKNYDMICSVSHNSANSIDYQEGLSKYDNVPLLSIISKSNKTKFSINHSLSEGSATQYLNENDLFVEGDTFTFENAENGIIKGGRKAESMNNGEKWNYKVEFIDMTKDEVQVKVSKVY